MLVFLVLFFAQRSWALPQDCDLNLGNMTVAYYDSNAEQYASKNGRVSPDIVLNRWYLTTLIPEHGAILELGAGPGRDAAYFLHQGFDVTMVEPSAKLAEIAAEKTGREPLIIRAQDIDFENEFDGIWASASLLHVPQEDLPLVLAKAQRALKSGGVLYASFIQGVGIENEPESIPDGRHFNRVNLQRLREIVSKVGGFEVIEDLTHETADDYHGEDRPSSTMGFLSLFLRKL